MIINIYDRDRTFVSSICDRLPKREFLDLKNGDRYPSISASKNNPSHRSTKKNVKICFGKRCKKGDRQIYLDSLGKAL